MIDYFIEASDEASFNDAISALGLVDGEGVAIDIIGTHYDYSNEEGVEAVARPGYFANVRSDAVLDWADNIVLHDPATPWRVWA
ncbi:hypothetical protein P3W53_03220 [Pseudomonas denitrificans (nom. rej.)]|nr:hypothetical protein [Pseudomonas denitrificans (nom. rej.)]